MNSSTPKPGDERLHIHKPCNLINSHLAVNRVCLSFPSFWSTSTQSRRKEAPRAARCRRCDARFRRDLPKRLRIFDPSKKSQVPIEQRARAFRKNAKLLLAEAVHHALVEEGKELPQGLELAAIEVRAARFELRVAPLQSQLDLPSHQTLSPAFASRKLFQNAETTV